LPPMAKTNPVEVERRSELRRLFREQCPDTLKANGNDVAIFHAWVSKNRPDLLPSGKGSDRYQMIRPDLEGLFTGS
jgi:hypothetical protein